MHGKSLKEVSDALIEAGDFLKEIQRDRKKFDCLRVFASSLDVVEWLRKETRSTLADKPFMLTKFYILESPIQVLMISITL